MRGRFRAWRDTPAVAGAGLTVRRAPGSPLRAVVGGAVLLATLSMLVLIGHADAAFPGANGKIVFTHYDGNDYEVYAITADGTNPRPLTSNDADDYRPSVSPSGRRIVFTSERGAGWRSEERRVGKECRSRW